MTHRNRALVGGSIWGALVVAAIFAVSLALRDRLPEPMASHWGLGGVADRSMTFTQSLLMSLGIWAAGLALLLGIAIDGRVFARRLGRIYWWSTLLWLGLFMVAIQASTVLANLDAPDWTAARMSGWSVVLLAALPLALGILGGYFLGRGGPDQVPPPGEAPPRLRLRPGQRSVWVSRVTNLWLVGLAVLPAVALAVMTALWSMGVLPTGVYLPALPGLVIIFLAGLLSATVTARVSDDGVAIGFGPFGWPVRRIRLSKIESAWAEERFPSQVGGWGFRGVPGMAAIMIRGGDCLVLRYRSGGQLVISIDDAARGASLVNALIGERVT